MTCFTDEDPPCPACEGPGGHLGRRGDLDHWQCRDCGLQFHTPADTDDDRDGDYPDW